MQSCAEEVKRAFVSMLFCYIDATIIGMHIFLLRVQLTIGNDCKLSLYNMASTENS